jgi:ABC-2 type transport system ATP-binding protein
MEHADPEPAIIRVENLEHSYGDFRAVDNISFSVKKGEIFSFLGPNGAGKSTVINILITLLMRQKGTAVVAGFDVTQKPQQVRESIGIVFQDITLDRDMTVKEILEFHGMLYNMPDAERKARIDELLKLVQLEAKKDELTKRLSGGMKRRLEIARGLMTRPTVLFLDEPTIGLDPQTRMRMWEYIKGVNDEGTTIFLTTHYMDEADQLSDRISIIDHGKIVITGTSWELKNTLGRDLIYLETDNNNAAIQHLEGVAAVRDIKEKSKGFILTVNEDGTKVLPTIIDTLRNKGIEISTINLKKPSMDDVFVFYTGKDLRDEGAAPARPRLVRARGR